MRCAPRWTHIERFTRSIAPFSCAEGCHACCAPDLSVTRVEADVIRACLAERPEVVESYTLRSVTRIVVSARSSMMKVVAAFMRRDP